MIAASLGYIPPVAGALLQEGIDVAVILNALRATFGAPLGPALVWLPGGSPSRADFLGVDFIPEEEWGPLH